MTFYQESSITKVKGSQAQRCMPIIPIFKKQRQENQTFKASLGY